MFLFFVLFVEGLQAQVFQGPLSRALGGAGRAGLETAESALLNPALVPLATNMEVNAFYGDGTWAPRQHRQYWGLGLADNSDDVLISGALHYVRMRETGTFTSPVSSELWHFALGQILWEGLSWGLSGYQLVRDPDGVARSTQHNASGGLLFMATPDLGFAYVLDNFLEPSQKVPAPLRQNRRQSLGAMYTFEGIARLRFDISRDEDHNPDHKLISQVGLESRSSRFMIVRLGAKWDNGVDQNFGTFGWGFNGPRLKLDYTLEKNFRGTGEAVHSVDMRLPF